MLPDGAEDRLLSNAKVIADACRKSGVEQWDLIGFQSYGHQLDIEAGKITMAAGGGEGGDALLASAPWEGEINVGH